MRQGWESQALNWAQFARTPGHDHSHEEINLPALLELLSLGDARDARRGAGTAVSRRGMGGCA